MQFRHAFLVFFLVGSLANPVWARDMLTADSAEEVERVLNSAVCQREFSDEHALEQASKAATLLQEGNYEDAAKAAKSVESCYRVLFAALNAKFVEEPENQEVKQQFIQTGDVYMTLLLVMGLDHFEAQRYPEAMPYFKGAVDGQVELEFTSPSIYVIACDQLVEIQLDQDDIENAATYSMACFLAFNLLEAEESEETKSATSGLAYNIALLSYAMEDKASAAKFMEESFSRHSDSVARFEEDERFADFRSDKNMLALVKKYKPK